MSRLRAAAVFSLLLVLPAVPAAETPHRAVNGQQLTSDSTPSITVDVSPAFKYVGRVPFALGDIAAGERHVFADLDGKRVKRLFVAQFEAYLPASHGSYQYSFEGALEMSGHRFRHTLGWYSDAALRQKQPGNEAALMMDFLVSKGYSVGDELLMSRFVTLGNEDRRSEFILFYLENARDDGVSIEGLEKDDAKWTAMKDALDQRSREAFKVVR